MEVEKQWFHEVKFFVYSCLFKSHLNIICSLSFWCDEERNVFKER